jgi:hypothetical protein
MVTWVEPAVARERAVVTRERSVRLRAELDWTLAVAGKEIGRARTIVAAGELAVGRGLVWEEPDGELDYVLVPLDGGILEPVMS